ncbi:MAG TPA: anaerobic ribonucleoside-triphosphate reductase activating protein [Burkholderiales bacterium]|nr:anaerobic ribonucleoside-triphosphate reductase activating protein [Burkholderiales bacterium]
MTKGELRIGGFVPFSATDYPDHLSAVVFCQGCPWRCGYCHNVHLQPATNATELTWSSILTFLEHRRGLLDAVVFSGGEPTLQHALAGAMHAVKALGFKVGLHTAGIYPQRLAEVLPLVDWVGLDIKAPFHLYDSVTRAPGSGARARRSAEIVLESGVAYEFRTTVDRSVLGTEDVAQLSMELPRMGATRYVLQACRANTA